MRTHIMGGARGISGALPRGGPGVAAYLGRLLILACALLGIAGDAFAVYSPRTGRFLQKDPNESGMLHAELWHGGEAPTPKLTAGSIDGVLIDGANLFLSHRASPWKYRDPLGTSVFPLEAPSPGAAGATAGMAVLAGGVGVALVYQYQSALLDMVMAVEMWMAGEEALGNAALASSEYRIAVAGGVQTLFSSEQAHAVGRASSKIARALEHLLLIEGTVATGNPQWDDDHHFKEIVNWLAQVRDHTARMGRRTADDFIRRANDIELRARRAMEQISRMK